MIGREAFIGRSVSSSTETTYQDVSRILDTTYKQFLCHVVHLYARTFSTETAYISSFSGKCAVTFSTVYYATNFFCKTYIFHNILSEMKANDLITLKKSIL